MNLSGTEEARRSDNLAVLDRFGALQDGSQLSLTQVTEALDQARVERELQLNEPDDGAR